MVLILHDDVILPHALSYMQAFIYFQTYKKYTRLSVRIIITLMPFLLHRDAPWIRYFVCDSALIHIFGI